MEARRREFIALSSLAAAGVMGGCAARSAIAPYRPDEKAFIKAALIHLGSNMWTDVRTPQKNDKPNPEDSWDFKDRVDYLRAKDDVWCDCIDAMKRNGFNMVVIDLGEALAYPSHPELAVKGTWSVEKMRRELDRLRGMGIEPIPKLNFSTTHNAWMKDWRHKVSSPEYLDTVDELIRDVAEIFDHPRFFHIGYDEETMGHQGGWGRYEYIVVRRGALYWRDFLRCVDTVRSTGCRPWCFSDKIWHDHDRFVKYMPRDVIMCPWNCVESKEKMYTKSIDEMAALGFDFIPDGSTYSRNPGSITRGELKHLMKYARAHIPAKNLKGFVICPWVTCTPGMPRQKFIDSMDFAGEMFAKWEAEDKG